MSEGRIVVGIDIGTSKIATVIARVDEFINVLGISEIASQGIRKGQIVDIVEAVESINKSLEAAERMAGYSASHIFVSIGGTHIESINSKGVVAVSSPQGEITSSDVTRVIDAARAVSLPSSREIIHVLPRSYTVDGQEGIKDPIAMSGIRLEVDTHIISANSTAIRNLEKALSEVGVDIDAAVYGGYASSLATLSDTERELGVILVDIGAGTTDISVYVEGSLAYSSVLAVGARHITNDLAIGLRISLESAEKIKMFLSNPEKQNKITEESEDKKSKSADEIDLSSLHLSEEISKVSRKTLVDGIIRPRLNEIFTFIGLEIKKSGFAGQTPSGIVITGGGAGTVGAVGNAKRTLAMPVRIGKPSSLKGIIDEIQNPTFSVVVGLVKYAGVVELKEGLPFGISIPKVPIFSGSKIFGKALDLIKSFIP